METVKAFPTDLPVDVADAVDLSGYVPYVSPSDKRVIIDPIGGYTDDTTSALQVNGNTLSNSFYLTPSTVGGLTAGFVGDGLVDTSYRKTVEFGFNAAQLGNRNTDYTGGIFRFDSRNGYPIFSIIYDNIGQTGGGGDEQHPFTMTTDGKFLIGNGWGEDNNAGTGNGEDLQVYDNAYVGGRTLLGAGVVDDTTSALQVNGVISAPELSNLAGDLTLTDAYGTTTLTALKSMRNIWISVTGQSEGNLTLSDATNWNAQYSFIDSIKVVTASTNWDMWLCETSAFNTALITTRQIAANANGNYDITVARSYNSDGTNVYLKYTDNAGTSTAAILITGEARRH